MGNPNLLGKELANHIVFLGKTGEECHLEELIPFLSSPNGNVRRLACSALGKIGSPKAETPLLHLLNDPKPQVRQYTIKALGGLGGSNSIVKLTDVVNNPNEKGYNIRAAKFAFRKVSKRVNQQEKHKSSPETEVVVTASEIRDFDYCNLKWQFKKESAQLGVEKIEKRIGAQELLRRKSILDRGERIHKQYAARPTVLNRWGWIILVVSLIFLFLLFLGGFG